VNQSKQDKSYSKTFYGKNSNFIHKSFSTNRQTFVNPLLSKASQKKEVFDLFNNFNNNDNDNENKQMITTDYNKTFYKKQFGSTSQLNTK